jgi:hypothetical protein
MMKIKILPLLILILFIKSYNIYGQSNNIEVKKYQAKAPKTQTFGKEAFKKSSKTIIR